MVEANRAYALGDEVRLRSILDAWEKSPEAVQGSDPDAARLRLVRRIAQMEDQLVRHRTELTALHNSPLWKLKTMVDEAAREARILSPIMSVVSNATSWRPATASTPCGGIRSGFADGYQQSLEKCGQNGRWSTKTTAMRPAIMI